MRSVQLEVHTNILQTVMNKVAERDVPVFFECESNFAKALNSTSGYQKSKNEVLQLVGDASKTNIEDKLRLICTFALSLPSATTADIDEAIALLQSSAAASPGKEAELANALKTISYVKKLRSMSQFSSGASNQNAHTPPPSGGVPNLSNLMNLGANVLGKAADKIGTLVLGKSTKFFATRVVEAMVRENRRGGASAEYDEGFNDYLYLDPKVKGGGGERAKRMNLRAKEISRASEQTSERAKQGEIKSVALLMDFRSANDISPFLSLSLGARCRSEFAAARNGRHLLCRRRRELLGVQQLENRGGRGGRRNERLLRQHRNDEQQQVHRRNSEDAVTNDNARTNESSLVAQILFFFRHALLLLS